MSQSKEKKNLKQVTDFDELTQEELTINILTSSLPFVEWVCSNFVYNGVNIWRRANLVNGAVNYTYKQLIKQYLNENC